MPVEHESNRIHGGAACRRGGQVVEESLGRLACAEILHAAFDLCPHALGKVDNQNNVADVGALTNAVDCGWRSKWRLGLLCMGRLRKYQRDGKDECASGNHWTFISTRVAAAGVGKRPEASQARLICTLSLSRA